MYIFIHIIDPSLRVFLTQPPYLIEKTSVSWQNSPVEFRFQHLEAAQLLFAQISVGIFSPLPKGGVGGSQIAGKIKKKNVPRF